MPAVVGVIAVVVMLVTFAAMLTIYPALWHSLSYTRRCTPADRRPRVRRVGAVMLALVVAVVALLIAAPWGNANPGYVMLIGVGGLLLAVLLVAGHQAFRDARRARRRRTAHHSPPNE